MVFKDSPSLFRIQLLMFFFTCNINYTRLLKVKLFRAVLNGNIHSSICTEDLFSFSSPSSVVMTVGDECD